MKNPTQNNPKTNPGSIYLQADQLDKTKQIYLKKARWSKLLFEALLKPF